MHEVAKPTQVNRLASKRRAVGIEVAVLQHFERVVQRVDDGALAGAVGTEEKRDGLQIERDPPSDTLEILQLNSGNHVARSSPRKAL